MEKDTVARYAGLRSWSRKPARVRQRVATKRWKSRSLNLCLHLIDHCDLSSQHPVEPARLYRLPPAANTMGKSNPLGRPLLEGICILDLADEKASFCTKLLADLGARHKMITGVPESCSIHLRKNTVAPCIILLQKREMKVIF